MKKTLLSIIISVFTLISCRSESNDNTADSSTQFFHPPSWIIGKWSVNGTALYKFTNDDFITIVQNQETSYKGLLQQLKNSGGNAIVSETTTDPIYDFTMSYGNAGQPQQSNQFVFKKISATKIEWVNYPYSSSTGAYYLDKQ